MAIPRREDGDFIEGIYNWCDRWCVKCVMTTKCRQYAMECTRDAFNADGSNDGDSAEFVESLIWAAGEFELAAEKEESDEFESGYEDLDSEAETYESGPDFDETDMEAYMIERDRIDRATSDAACVKSADQYMSEGGRWLDEWGVLIEDQIERDLEIREAVEVVDWYLMQIPVKLRRAISGKIDEDFEFMDDVYGTAKIVLIGGDRSLAAWETIKQSLPAEKRDSLDPVTRILSQMIEYTEVEVPEARAFKRPGLDE